MAVQLRNTVAQLYTRTYDEFSTEGYDEPSLVMPQLFEELPDKSKQVDVDMMSGGASWESYNELEALRFDTRIHGYPKTFTHLDYRDGFQVSFQAADDDEYALIKKQTTAKEMGMGARARVETLAASHFNNAFSTGAYAGPDGAALVSASHPKNRLESTTYYSNFITTALSETALTEMNVKIADNMRNMRGIIMTIKPSILLVPPALEDVAIRITSPRATERPGTMNRDINVHAGKYKVVVWDYLTSALYWFLIVPKYRLRWYWREKINWTSWVDYNVKAYSFEGSYRASSGFYDWRWCWGSNGTT